MEPDQVRESLSRLREQDVPTHGGHTLAYVYDSGLSEVDRLARDALADFAYDNGLDPTAFPGLLRMENDLVGMACDLLHAPESAVGSVTSGGTESILLAVQVARDAHRDATRPELVLPTTAHAAFHKAAHYFGLDMVLVDVDPATKRADPAAMASSVTENTVLVVASAPSYAHGVADPVTEIAHAASERGVRCHVDACIGGWVLPFVVAHGEFATPFDFAVEGVTSISVDLHKYAYTPKGASVLLHRSAELRRPQFFSSANWPGYTMLNSTTQSTRSGAPIAAAWAVTRAIGMDGYAELAARVRAGVAVLVDGIAAIDHVRVVAPPDAALVAVTTDDDCDVFTVCDEMAERGWYVQPQLSFRGEPPTMHMSLSAATTDHIAEFLAALAEAIGAAVAAGPVQVDPGLRATAESIDPSQLDDAAFDGLLEVAGLGSGGELALPERMAPVNALLDVAPSALRETLLVAFLDRLSRPNRRQS